MKTIKIRLLIIAALLCSISASAYDFEVDGIYYNITSSEDLTVSVTYKGSDQSSAVYSGNVVIPGSVEYNGITYSVTSIGYSAFENCSNLASIAIPNSVTSIGASIFSGCDNLTSIVVEEDNPVYDSRGNCNAIIRTATNKLIRGCQSTIIPNSVTSIGRTAFNGCTRLTSITIPNGVTSIEDNAFNGCTNLTSITISNSVTSIEQAAFYNSI